MTDWDYILENIRNAAQASEEFRKAGEELINHHTLDEVEAFAGRMRTLQDELDRLLIIMSRGSQAVSDEIAGVFTQLVYRRRIAYHSTPELPGQRTEEETADS